MKRIIAALLFVLMLHSAAYAEEIAADRSSNAAKVYINGDDVGFTVSVLDMDDELFVPIRPIFESLNFKITWDEMRKRIVANTAIGKLTFSIGSVLVCQNNYQSYVLEHYPRIYNGSTMIPLKFAAECTDSNIVYSKEANSVTIMSH